MEAAEKHVLALRLPTDPRWAKMVQQDLGQILTDHAYCEQKAASSGISLIVSYSNHPGLVETLAPIVAEEWGHFRAVLAELSKRGLKLGAQRKDDYVAGLLRIKRSGNRMENLVEHLLMNALIEARSCERFRVLNREIADEGLKAFYYDLMVSEAGHYRTFLDLAETCLSKEEVRARWQHWLDAEAELVATLEPRPDRMH